MVSRYSLRALKQTNFIFPHTLPILVHMYILCILVTEITVHNICILLLLNIILTFNDLIIFHLFISQTFLLKEIRESTTCSHCQYPT